MVNHKVSVVDGYPDGVLQGAALGTIDGDIFGPADSLSFGLSLGSLHGSFRRV